MSVPSTKFQESTLCADRTHDTPARRTRRIQQIFEARVPRLAGARISRLARRALNVATAAVLIAVTAPLMLAIALAIRLTSPGPVLFVQTRIGLDRRNGGRPLRDCRRSVDRGGKLFRMYKFRTMCVDSGNEGKQEWASPDDPRVTPLGRILRKHRLDELPQLFNVLRGDMNLVGPRPEQPDIFAKLRTQLDGYPERQRVRPGITGWAQVTQHYDTCIEDVRNKLALDLEYIRQESLLQDLKIMAKTVPTVVFRRGAW